MNYEVVNLKIKDLSGWKCEECDPHKATWDKKTPEQMYPDNFKFTVRFFIRIQDLGAKCNYTIYQIFYFIKYNDH